MEILQGGPEEMTNTDQEQVRLHQALLPFRSHFSNCDRNGVEFNRKIMPDSSSYNEAPHYVLVCDPYSEWEGLQTKGKFIEIYSGLQEAPQRESFEFYQKWDLFPG